MSERLFEKFEAQLPPEVRKYFAGLKVYSDDTFRTILRNRLGVHTFLQELQVPRERMSEVQSAIAAVLQGSVTIEHSAEKVANPAETANPANPEGEKYKIVELSEEDLGRVFKTALRARLAKKRDRLLCFLDRIYEASLSNKESPARKLESDLEIMNKGGVLPDGTDPLSIWLRNAYDVSHDIFFLRALEKRNPKAAIAYADLLQDTTVEPPEEEAMPVEEESRRFNKLSREDIEKIATAAIDTGLGYERNALLVCIIPEYTAYLPEHSSSGMQLRSDLLKLNESVTPVGGDDPLAMWLNIAFILSAGDSRKKVFQEALKKRSPQSEVDTAGEYDQNPVSSDLSSIPSPTSTENDLRKDFETISPDKIHKRGEKLPFKVIRELAEVLCPFPRDELIKKLETSYVMSFFQRSATPVGQLIIDLAISNETTLWQDGSDPLARLLKNALELNLRDPDQYCIIRRALRTRQRI